MNVMRIYCATKQAANRFDMFTNTKRTPAFNIIDRDALIHEEAADIEFRTIGSSANSSMDSERKAKTCLLVGNREAIKTDAKIAAFTLVGA
mmetsp:Transcript_9781/g.10850  ORF Transcript_9781/g.10850 Transcript_9781/m.10850 type:complete len:91 (-) Transcript_9781:699-971(-)|eukprot:CAMPEP_0168536314 /NCGR_PEP_ID=MMETSP0405-20121227/19460_1 /TAXON_ID=498012 /ORGANISM="Trichosphaerium sp, Strain Am-I-7 wt" /LENGTH=90 /DNA_ID=CAMNT_0008564265 /DNA_START=256 /DNA_END=528 /DNA_ORIENTATION=+